MEKSMCSRCNKKASVTSDYTAQSSLQVSKAYADANGIKNPEYGAIDKNISTCNICTSPISRRTLHARNVFKKYEHQFLNLIIEKVNQRDHQITMNKTNISDNKQYDTLITTGDKDHKPFIALNIEVDEFGHYTKEDYFTRDRAKEQNFFNVWETQGAKAHIIRVRVGETFNTACVTKTGTRTNAVCSVVNSQSFDMNMEIVQKYINDVLSGRRVKNHVYINFSDTNGLIDYPYTTFASVKTEKFQPQKLNNIETLVSDFNNVKISNDPNPDGKRMECIKSRCKEKTSAKSGLCKRHRL